jgi:transglutaminase-like putative cysteine protease
MRLDIRYRCTFEYEDLVRHSQNELRACPASDAHQSLVSYRVTTTPSARVFSFDDYWGTRIDTFGVREPHILLEVVAEASVETRAMPLLTSSPRFERLGDPEFLDEHQEYLQPTSHADWGAGVAAEARRQLELVGPDVISVVLALHRSVGSTMRYAPGSTYVGVGVEEVLATREGVCQDFAHLAVALCRSIGIPARYVSGYLFTRADETGADTEADVVEVQTHAWFEAAIPGVGWLALDPTNGLEVGMRHVKIGHGRDYDDVPPLRGMYSGAVGANLEVAVEMRRPPSGVLPQPVPWSSQAIRSQQTQQQQQRAGGPGARSGSRRQ